LRLQVLGLGQSSLHRTHHPGVRQRLVELERFRALTDLTGDLLLVADLRSGQILELNETVCRRLGRSRSELLASTFEGLFGAAAWQLVAGPAEARAEHCVRTTELRLAGAAVPVEVVTQLAGSATDAT
jgi:PAS domain-containing protein